MNVEEKAKFFKKRAKILKEIDDATGIPEYKRKELHEMGLKPMDLRDMPLCQIKSLLSKNSKTVDTKIEKHLKQKERIETDEFN